MNEFKLEGKLTYSDYHVSDEISRKMMSVLTTYPIDDFRKFGGTWNKEDSYALYFLVETLLANVGNNKSVAMNISLRSNETNALIEKKITGTLILRHSPLDIETGEQFYVGKENIGSFLSNVISSNEVSFKSIEVRWVDDHHDIKR